MKKLIFTFSLLLCLFIPKDSQAFTVKKSQIYQVPADTQINDNLYVASDDLTVDGKIDGDLKFITSNLTINGEINGDVIGFAEKITINGSINGNLRIAGEKIIVNGKVLKNADIACSNLYIGSQAQIGKDLLFATKETTVDGSVNSDLHGVAQIIKINGQIGRNVFLRFFEEKPKTSLIEIGQNAKVAGSLNYTAQNNIKIGNSAAISDGIHYTAISPKWEKQWGRVTLWKNILGIFSALIVGLVLTTLFGKKIKDLNLHIKNRPSISALIGIATMFCTPFVALILLISIIGIPLSLITIVFYFLIIYLSRIFIAIYLGGLVIKKANPEKQASLFWSMVIGIIVSWTFFSVPVVGWFLSIFATWWGMGAILLYAKDELTEK